MVMIEVFKQGPADLPEKEDVEIQDIFIVISKQYIAIKQRYTK